jgi:hypothetical protein
LIPHRGLSRALGATGQRPNADQCERTGGVILLKNQTIVHKAPPFLDASPDTAEVHGTIEVHVSKFSVVNALQHGTIEMRT